MKIIQIAEPIFFFSLDVILLYDYVNQLQCCSNCGGGLFSDAQIMDNGQWSPNFARKRASQDTSQTRTK